MPEFQSSRGSAPARFITPVDAASVSEARMTIMRTLVSNSTNVKEWSWRRPQLNFCCLAVVFCLLAVARERESPECSIWNEFPERSQEAYVIPSFFFPSSEILSGDHGGSQTT